MTSRRLRRHVRAWCSALVCAAMTVPATAQQPSEYQVKAAFLFNFARFVEWPPSAFPSPDAPIVLCLAGYDPFNADLHALVRGEQVGGRPVDVRVVAEPDATASRSCHVLFVPAGRRGVQSRFLATVAGAPVLTVSDDVQALYEGGIIAFELQERRVRFAINPRPATTVGLRLSARLLQVARIVEDGPR